MPSPFGSRPDAGRPPPRDGYGNPPQGGHPYQQRDEYDGNRDPMGGARYGASRRRDDYDTVMTDVDYGSRGYGGPPPPQRGMPPRPGGGRPTGGAAGSPVWSLRPEKSPNISYTFGNLSESPS